VEAPLELFAEPNGGFLGMRSFPRRPFRP